MDTHTLIAISIGLAMDATAVSIAKGLSLSPSNLLKYALILGISFGFAQALMPLLGYLLGKNFLSFIQSLDHWIAFIVLGGIGLNMIKESFHHDESDQCVLHLPFKVVALLALATSIDALAVGVSLALFKVNIWQTCAIIGLITFVLCFFACLLAKQLGKHAQQWAEKMGGAILIILAFKILIEHLSQHI